jgi:hypothetical protein
MAHYLMTEQELIEEGMAPHAIKAFLKLQSLGCPVKTWYHGDRGHFWIDGEASEAEEWLDYYHNFIGSDPLNDILSANGLWFEWQNSAVACVYNI